MEIYEKIRSIRESKGWTQEQVAEKLGWSAKTYAKMEHDGVKIRLDKLQKIAEILEIDIKELFNCNDRAMFNFSEIFNNTTTHNAIFLTETQCVHELEKYQLIVEHKDKEIAWLNEKIANLQEILALLKQDKT